MATTIERPSGDHAGAHGPVVTGGKYMLSMYIVDPPPPKIRWYADGIWMT
jgi:hypothetical protein